MGIPFAVVKKTANDAKRLQKSGAICVSLNDVDRYYGGPDLGFLSLEYLLCSNVWLLSTIYQLFGKEGCGKTTIAIDLLTRYALNFGANGLFVDTENKINVDLLRRQVSTAIQDTASTDQFMIARTTDMETAQSVMLSHIRMFNERLFGKKVDRSSAYLLGMVLDSIRVTSKQTQETTIANGYAQKAFAWEAQGWRTFLATFINQMQHSPMFLIATNHEVEKTAPGGYGTVKDVGGGRAWKFWESYQFLVQSTSAGKSKTEVASDMTIRTYKNSNGQGSRIIYPRIVYKSPEMPEDNILVDWATADAKLLSGDHIPRAVLSKKGICNTKESSKSGLYSDDILGLTCVPIQEITAKIYSEPDRLAALRKELGIVVYRNLEQLWEHGWFFDARKDVPNGDSD